MDDIEYWILQHKGIIWHYTWRGAFVILLVWLMRSGYVSMLQMACFGGICFCIASILMLSVKRDRQKELEHLQGKDNDEDDKEEPITDDNDDKTQTDSLEQN